MNTVLKQAQISACGRYRYSLSRVWGQGRRVGFIMLNPSTADAAVDDPTLRRCVGFARGWGFAGLEVGNLYAMRSTSPTGLWTVADPVGPDNDAALRLLTCRVDLLVVAWGAHAKLSRVEEVLPVLGQPQCLGVTASGQPRHPLYLRRDTALIPWPGQHR